MTNDLDYLRARLKSLPHPVARIAREAGVKERWVRAFVAGGIPEPGYGKVQALWLFLATVDRLTIPERRRPATTDVAEPAAAA